MSKRSIRRWAWGKLPDEGFYNRLAGCVPRKISAGRDVTSPTPATSARPCIVDLLPPPFEWCQIPARKVTLDEGGYVPTGGQPFDVPAFAIAKYPVTNMQFVKIVEAGGYNDK